jgi:ureidoglycolate hydrolase
MNEAWLQIRDYSGAGYQPLIDFGRWRVAILRFLDELQPDQIRSMERHTQTDEVFVLLHGRALLIMGGNGDQVEGIHPQPMDPGKIYNVRCDAWHTILLSRDASVLLVENQDTGSHNSEYILLPSEHRRQIQALAGEAGFF